MSLTKPRSNNKLKLGLQIKTWDQFELIGYVAHVHGRTLNFFPTFCELWMSNCIIYLLKWCNFTKTI